MGKMALLLVLGLGVTVGIISYTINLSKKSLGENVAGFDRYTNARNIAHTGVNMMLHQIDLGASPIWDSVCADRTGSLALNFGEGSYATAGQCTVTVKRVRAGVPDSLQLNCYSRYRDSLYTMKLKLKSYPKPFPGINGAVCLASTPFNFNMNGTPHIYGQNYNMDGSRGPAAQDTNGVTVNTAAESTTVALASGGRITGDPKAVAVAPPDNPLNYVQEYINGADNNFASGNYGGTYGSAIRPVIGYANGSVKFNGSGSFYGVLVVHGTVEFSGTFDMYGLVIAYGDSSTVSVSASTGTPQVFGAIVATGPPGSTFTMKGTADVRFSTQALAMAKNMTKLQAYKVISWFETDRR